MEHVSGTLVAAGMTKRFGAFVAVDSVDFTLKSDEAVGIVGRNGAGKTSLLNLLAGAYRRPPGRWFSAAPTSPRSMPPSAAALASLDRTKSRSPSWA